MTSGPSLRTKVLLAGIALGVLFILAVRAGLLT